MSSSRLMWGNMISDVFAWKMAEGLLGVGEKEY